MKKFLLLLFILSCLSCGAQTTAITATVVDSDGTTWAGGSWKISFITNGNIQNMASYNQNGVPLSNSVLFQSGVMNGSGVFKLKHLRLLNYHAAGKQLELNCMSLSYSSVRSL
jgi:hypothetical protein